MQVLCEIIGAKVDVNLERDAIAIENLRQHTEKEQSILNANPALATEWNYEKNGSLRPENIVPNSNKKVWWKCSKGHEWQAIVNSRNRGNGCPYCASQKVLAGYNDLQTINPTLSLEWNFERNDNISPWEVMPNSEKKVWWKCSEGHEWQASVGSRNSGKGCPYCAGRYAVLGKNDLRSTNPVLSSEWNYDKNIDLVPEKFSPNSHKKVWWKCTKGHEWQAIIAHRNNGVGCPYCSGRYAIHGENDLQTINPALAKEWNFEKTMS